MSARCSKGIGRQPNVTKRGGLFQNGLAKMEAGVGGKKKGLRPGPKNGSLGWVENDGRALIRRAGKRAGKSEESGGI